MICLETAMWDWKFGDCLKPPKFPKNLCVNDFPEFTIGLMPHENVTCLGQWVVSCWYMTVLLIQQENHQNNMMMICMYARLANLWNMHIHHSTALCNSRPNSLVKGRLQANRSPSSVKPADLMQSFDWSNDVFLRNKLKSEWKFSKYYQELEGGGGGKLWTLCLINQ